MSKNKIEIKKSEKLIDFLNDLLANYQIFYMNVRGYHWNIKGPNFFFLHPKYEEIYNDLLDKLDSIAERILTLGETPIHSYSKYLKLSGIKEDINITSEKETLKGILNGFKILIEKQKKIKSIAEKLDDDGTSSLMDDYIKEEEKLSWMLSASLK